MTTENADYCMVFTKAGSEPGLVLESELGQNWRYGLLKMFMLKVVSSEKILGLKS